MSREGRILQAVNRQKTSIYKTCYNVDHLYESLNEPKRKKKKNKMKIDTEVETNCNSNGYVN